MGVSINTNGKISEGQVYVPRLEPTAPIRLADRNHAHCPSRHCTILKKRWLNDGLPAYMIPSKRESLEDVIYMYTWHTKSMLLPGVYTWPRYLPDSEGRQGSRKCRTFSMTWSIVWYSLLHVLLFNTGLLQVLTSIAFQKILENSAFGTRPSSELTPFNYPCY